MELSGGSDNPFIISDSKFTIITDHQPLLSCLTVDTKKDATGKRTRWSLELNSNEFEIKHKKGKLYTDADARSRAPYADPPRDENEEEIVTLAPCPTLKHQ
jgi:hypothetical protein